MSKKIDAIKDPEAPIAAEVMEQAIVEIAAGMKKLNATRLNRRAIVCLIKDATGHTKGDIENVLNCLDQLESLFLKKR